MRAEHQRYVEEALQCGSFQIFYLLSSVGACAGTGFNDHAQPDAKGKPRQKVMDAMDNTMGNIGLGTKAFEPPFTRAKYLEYFRSIAYGDASLRKHGGNRRVDIQMATELSNLYAQHASMHGSIKAVAEDDVSFSGHVSVAPLCCTAPDEGTVRSLPALAMHSIVACISSLLL